MAVSVRRPGSLIVTTPSCFAVFCVATLLLATSVIQASAAQETNAGLTLPPGFKATIFADKVGLARHMVVAPDGTLYVNTLRGPRPEDGFLAALKDTKGDGHADQMARFGPSRAQGKHGGTGIAFYDGKLYVEAGGAIVRYALAPGALAPAGAPEIVVSGLPLSGDHPMHPIAIDPKGDLFVDLGSATNACQEDNRAPGSPGLRPCVEKQTRAGIWRYDATKTGQVFSAAGRFASGLRNGEGVDFDAQGRIYATQHGRDQLHEDWPALYSPPQGQELPAEELVQLTQGADFGWPECYFDGMRKRLVLAPEYGGDGKTEGVCATRTAPVAFFPAHYAPNAMKIYRGTAFPKAYRGGAFIAFHGSWNRAPGPQGGYNVVFQPLADGKASGPWTVFADGFAEGKMQPGSAPHRPSGIAIGPKGALYVSDDVGGRIWRITYEGSDNQ